MAIPHTGAFYLNPSFSQLSGQRFMAQQFLIRIYNSNAQSGTMNSPTELLTAPKLLLTYHFSYVILRSKQKISRE